MRPYSPGGELNALAPALKGTKPPTPSSQRLRLGLRGYLILFAPQLSCLSVSIGPESRFRHRCSSRYLRISPLHREFRSPLPYSSTAVSDAFPRVSRELSHPTYNAAYAPFTPSKSEQRLPPLYYRGCWHRVSRGFLLRYHQARAVLAPGRFFPHDRSLQPEGLHPPRGVASSHFRALRMILDCSLP